MVALSRTMRWVGWGFGESLIPIFIFSFAGSFAEAGLLRSVFEVTLLFCLPLAGVLADRVSARALIIAGLVVYPLVGVSYFLAGVTGMGVYIVLARFSNAIGWGLESTGVDTYYRRMASPGRVASAFGFIDTLAQGGWVIAALIGVALLDVVPLHYLLLLIAPTSLGALYIAWRAPKDPLQAPRRGPSLASSYAVMLREWRSWGGDLRLLGALVFFMGLIEALMWFFIPIDAYLEGANLGMVVLLTVVASMSPMFGYALGRFADFANKRTLVIAGLLFIAVVMVVLALFPGYVVKLAASFVLGLILELFVVVQKSLVTTLGPAATYGERGGAFASIGDLGDIAAPLLLGVMLDALGFSIAAILIAWAAIALSASFTALRFGPR